MAENQIECAIMFADLVGSSRLYDTLGDTRALAIVHQCLDAMAEPVVRHSGTVVKTMGDGILSRFADADSAAIAACELHEGSRRMSTREPHTPPLRIGLHYGPILVQDDDVYGDAVNVASRLSAVATAGQIITTDALVAHLSKEMAEKTREYDRAPVKGKRDKIIMYEFMWSPGEITHMPRLATTERTFASLSLEYAGQTFELRPESSTLTIGRDSGCNITVAEAMASRRHASVNYSRGKFVLSDHSTNGTYIFPEGGQRVFLRREQAPLLGVGVICIGQPDTGDPHCTIRYSCE